ncbi:MAG TPA: cobyrinate a,c-diamide synthase [Kineosporiaceae bacterium]|nr:cobyrinate a,c-diamide synthase [Kineosporiaceae bacterium]
MVARIVVAAPASGHGKTSVATGLLGAFAARGLQVSPHKVGPDYIDPGYHALAAGRPGRTLDPWLVGEERIVPLFRHGVATPRPADLAVIEGVMGLYDGAAGRGEFASTAQVARLLSAPVLLVVDSTAMGRSVAAVVAGFIGFDPRVRIGGVILNRVGSDRHEMILRAALAEIGVPVLGALRRHDALATPSRHLGLVPVAERSSEAVATVRALAEVVAGSVDLDAVLALARSAGPLSGPVWNPVDEVAVEARPDPAGPRPVIAVAGGAAFTFSYAETGELLTAAGADVVTVDPLNDEFLPAGTSGLVIGGGFPELHADRLAANRPLRAAVAALAGSGAAIAAECAGLLYLARLLDGKPMCGVLPTDAAMTSQLTLGYREATAMSDSILARAGTVVRGHEFHRTACAPTAGTQPTAGTSTDGGELGAAWRWSGADGSDRVEGFVRKQIHASYLHLHWAGVPAAAAGMVAAARTAATAKTAASVGTDA